MQSNASLVTNSQVHLKVLKRDGRIEDFSIDKLRKHVPSELIEEILSDISSSAKDNAIETKTIADIVEKHIIQHVVNNASYEVIAKRYVLARIYNHVYNKKWDKFDEKDLLLSYNALKVLEARYLLKNPATLRYIETPQAMFRRVAHFLAETKEEEEKFYEIMSSLKFLPNTPTLMNSGTRLGILSACFVLPVKDSMITPEGDGIYDTLRAMAIVHQQGGGTGFDFSELRPKGDVVASTAGVASGPVSFMKIFDVSTDVVKQGGKRRGANMGILASWHPDVEEFIKSKTGESRDVHLQNFNISVAIHDAFMESMNSDIPWRLINPRKTGYLINKARNSITEEWVQEAILQELEEKGSVYLDESVIVTLEEATIIAEKEQAVSKVVNPREIFAQIVKGAWESGDPGLIFIDEINRRHPVWYLGKIQATNPCAEEPLLQWESCNLGSINLEKFVNDGKIDWEGLISTIKYGIRLLDRVIDKNRYPLKQIENATKRTRKVGLGVMGLARMLIKLGIPYDSVDAIYFSYQLSKFIYYYAFLTSIELAKEKGAFPDYNPSLYRDIFDTARSFEYLLETTGINGPISERVRDVVKLVDSLDFAELKRLRVLYGLRNSTVTSIAPTGTISIIAGTSSGIEPLFALAFIRNVAVGKFIEIDPLFLDYLRKYEMDYPEVIEKVAETGMIKDMPMPKSVKKLFRTAHEISPEYHLLHQAAWQQWNDSGVSKTINLREEESVETVWRVYTEAWKLGIKGITVYRDRSKSKQVIYFGLKQEKEKIEEEKKAAKSLRIAKVEVDENFAGGCATCEL
ncbi:ribonucleoside-diphosphate reductase, adenosylcobalamin-dependent [Sulfolobales archaeon HS-7]|nr:ribonucleoside-diphosphate reductase, adenosylcobalamin-dependent [Sulfolobales archaeon HS-7]